MSVNAASHTNGTVVTIDDGQVSNIDKLPFSINVHDISVFIKSAESAFKSAQKPGPGKPML